MKRLLFVFVIFLLAAEPCLAEDSLAITLPVGGKLIAANKLFISWRTSLPVGTSYSIFSSESGIGFVTVAEGLKGSAFEWQVVHPEEFHLWLRVQARDQKGSILAEDTREYTIVPETCIIVSKKNQRVWWFKSGKLRGVMLCSTASPEYHLHEGWFSVYQKEQNHWSSIWGVDMPYSMFFIEGHALHATKLISGLGKPVSNGCVRLSPRDAKRLYNATPIGTPVVVMPDNFDCTFLGRPK